MSNRQEEEARGMRPPKKRKSTRANALTTFVAFHPTKEEKGHIKSDDRDFNDIMLSLSTWVEDGHKLAIGYKVENEAWSCALREGGQPFGKALTLSAWHSDLFVAMKALDFALRTKYARFPDIHPDLSAPDVDW